MSIIKPAQKIVFCDFDGTITAVETFVATLKEFAPELSKEILPQIFNRSVTLRQGVRRLLESIPSRLYDDVLAYSDDKLLREGLGELLLWLQDKEIPFVVISGGLKDMVKRVLSRSFSNGIPLTSLVKDIVGVDMNRDGEFCKVYSQFEGGDELVAKVEAMSLYPAEIQVAIGDSVTDINMALKADIVFARDRLMDYLNKENKSYYRWENFLDIRNSLIQLWGE